MVQPSPPNTPRHHHAGGCSQPVLLRGRVDHIDGSTGELIHRYATVSEPGGVLPVACKTRRASRCLPCAETYRADTYQVIRSGLSGGKGVPATVAAHPAVFLTLTAPSFGQVHARRERNGRVLACRPRRKRNICEHGRTISCAQRHDRHDARLGEPLCAECYDYTGTVLFNACAPELWRRFTIALHRALARHTGITAKKLRAEARISYAKVAEYQRRGIVHFHAIIRLDGPDGPTTCPPAWATVSALTAAIADAIRVTSLATPAAVSVPARRMSWGNEHDIRPISTSGEVTDTKVAAYVAKYATKAAECTGTLDRRIAPTDRLTTLPVTGHARRLIAECLRLSQLPELEELRLAAWAHMLGFRGHFSTKSRRYSTTLTALRSARANHQRERAIAAGQIPDTRSMANTVLVISAWSYSGRGHPWLRSSVELALTPDQPRPGGESRWT